MPENQKVVTIENLNNDHKIARVRFTQDLSPNRLNTYLTAALDKCFQHNYSKIIIDLEQIVSISNAVIATLIEATAKVRRKQGDIKIINMSEELKQIMAGFNALTFLSISAEE
jgi:anti-anti-sigma factor